MIFYSTKTASLKASLEEAVFKSLPPDNGLYMPESIPKVSQEFLNTIENKSFKEIAVEITYTLLGDDISLEDIEKLIDDSYDFDAPVLKITPDDYVLELFHGPSMAFKDFGARFMAALMSHFLVKSQKRNSNSCSYLRRYRWSSRPGILQSTWNLSHYSLPKWKSKRDSGKTTYHAWT